MTWYADEILLRATPSAIAAVAAVPRLDAFTYLVRALEGHAWHRPDIRHGLPEDGLLVIRPVRAPECHGEEWYEEPVLDWTSLHAGPEDDGPLDDAVTRKLADYLAGQGTDLARDDPLQEPAGASAAFACENDEDETPTVAFRSFLASLARSAATPVMYYSALMWGGDIEKEYCLLYEPEESLLTTTPESGFEPGASEDSLQAGLQKLGIILPTGYFALHTRGFPWEVHKLIR